MIFIKKKINFLEKKSSVGLYLFIQYLLRHEISKIIEKVIIFIFIEALSIIINNFVYNLISASGAMVIVVETEHGDTSSNLGRDWLHFT